MWGKGEFNVEFTQDFVKGLLFNTKRGENSCEHVTYELKDISSS